MLTALLQRASERSELHFLIEGPDAPSRCHNVTLILEPRRKGFNNLGEREEMDGGLALFLSYSVREAYYTHPIYLE